MEKWKAYAVHVYTASGMLPVLFAAIATCRPEPAPAAVFLWLAAATLIDSTDGPLARRFQVARHAAAIRGRTLDDIIDYLNFTFVPLLLVWRMEWVREPRWLFVAVAMVASLFGFANVRAKEEQGFFVGFPSYWNVTAFYLGIWAARFGPLVPTLLVLALAALTLVPLRFVYPNLAPPLWRKALIAGGMAWLALFLLMLPSYPRAPLGLAAGSLLYPFFYLALSWHLSRGARSRP